MSFGGAGEAMEWLVRDVLGECNAKLSDQRRGELRFGRRGSLSVLVPPHPRAGTWFDYEAWVGGGVAQLRAHVQGAGVTPSARNRGTVNREPSGSRDDAGRRLWERGQGVPDAGSHPVRLWMARRGLWRAGVPAPSSLRWVWDREGGGTLLALSARPAEWVAAWPGAPAARGVQRLPLDRDGQAAGPKKSLGPMYGGVMVLGPPEGGEEAVGAVCEGVADGLALSSLGKAVVVVSFGTGGMLGAAGNGLADYLAGFGGGVEVWADRDPASERRGGGLQAPAGARAGHVLARAVRAAGGRADVWQVEEPWKDVAERTEAVGIGEADDDRLTEELAAFRGLDWPRWYAAQRASVAAVGLLAVE